MFDKRTDWKAQKYEYKVIDAYAADKKVLIEKLNAVGLDGWKLIDFEEGVAILMREI